MSNTETKQVLAAMFKENTGTHFLDSGGANGRHWQRNQERSLADEPQATMEAYVYGDGDLQITVTVNTYQWLVDRLEYNAELTEAFEAFSAEQGDTYYLQDMEEWAREIGGAGIYGEGEPCTVNTYNHDNVLDQTIQFTYFTLDNDEHSGAFVLLQIHGGADVRGGYTAPKVFEVSDYDGTSIFDYARASIGCNREKNDLPQTEIPGLETEPCEMFWDTDDSVHWYAEGSCGLGAGQQLEEYEATKAEDGEEWTRGKVHVNEDGSILCPCCGSTVSVGYY